MNILMVTGAFAKNGRDTAFGGMEKAVYTCTKGMMDRGHDVKILTVDSKSGLWKYDGIDIISVGSINIFGDLSDITLLVGILEREFRIQKVIQKINKKWKIDIIQYTGWYGIGLFHFFKIPSVMRVSSYTNLQFKQDFSKKRIIMFSTLECLAARRMDFVFAPGNLMAEKLGKDSGRKISVIETPYVQENVVEDDGVSEILMKGTKYLLFFGRLSFDKGIYVIKDILYEVLNRHRDICFVFAGSGTVNHGMRIETELENAAGIHGSRVFCLGKLQKSKLVPVIKNAEMVVIPSIRDNLPNACAEAMAYGKIVIGTEGSSLEQFITEGINGFLAKPGDPASLLQKIEIAFNIPDIQKYQMCESAVRRIKKLDIDIYSKRMEQIYQNVILDKQAEWNISSLGKRRWRKY